MAFMAVLESDLRALSAEARRRYPAVKDAAEHAILKLRSLSSPNEIAHNEDILRIFLMACDVKTVKLSVIGLSCLQKLIAHDAVAHSAVKYIISTLKEHAEMTDESVQLKTLQTILIVFQSHLHPLEEDNMAQALGICLRLLESSRSSDSVRNTAAATFRQAVALVFDSVASVESLPSGKFGSNTHVSRTSTITEEISRSFSSSVSISNDFVSGGPTRREGLTKVGKLGLRLLEDLTALAAGGSASWLRVVSVQRTFALDILEFILSNYVSIFQNLVPYEQVLRHQVCSLLMTSLRTNLELEGEAGEPTFRRLVLRAVANVIRMYSLSLVTECEVFLNMLVKVTRLDLPLWHRILVLEVLRVNSQQLKPLQDSALFELLSVPIQSEDPKNTNVVENMVKALARVVSTIQMVPESSDESLAAVAGMFSSKAKGIEWSMDSDASNAAVLVASEAHAITLAIEGLLGVVYTVATLIDEAVEVGELESPRCDTDTSVVYTGKIAVLCISMVNSTWLTILDSLSLILMRSQGEAIILEILKGYQAFTQACGVLRAVEPLNSFLASLCKFTINIPNEGEKKRFAIPPWMQNNVFHKILSSILLSPGAKKSDPVPDLRDNVVLTQKNVQALRTLFNVAHRLHNVLGPSWILVLETLASLDRTIHSPHASTQELSSSVSRLARETPGQFSDFHILSSLNSQLFESSAIMHVSAVKSLLSALRQLSSQCSNAHSMTPIQHIGGVAFSVERMKSILVNNLHRIEPLWDQVVAHLLELADSSNPQVRNLALDALDQSICTVVGSDQFQATKASKHPMPNAEEAKDTEVGSFECVVLSPLLVLFMSSQNFDVRVGSLKILLHVLERHGEKLYYSWPSILKLLRFLFYTLPTTYFIYTMPQSACVARAVADASEKDLVPLGFQSMRIIMNDGLSTIPAHCLNVCIEVTGAYSAQNKEINISLTAIGLLWAATDFIAKGLAQRLVQETHDGAASADDSITREINAYETVRDNQAIPAMEAHQPVNLKNLIDYKKLLFSVFFILQNLAADERPEVRNSAIRTLFQTLGSHGQKISRSMWEDCLSNYVFPILDRVSHLASTSSREEWQGKELGTRGGKAIHMLIHHSRNTAQKQWDETIVLVLGGITRILRSFFPFLQSLSNFAACWDLLLDFVKSSILNGSKEAAIAAISCLQTIVSSHCPKGNLAASYIKSILDIYELAIQMFPNYTTSAANKVKQEILLGLGDLFTQAHMIFDEEMYSQLLDILHLAIRSSKTSGDLENEAIPENLPPVLRTILEILPLLRPSKNLSSLWPRFIKELLCYLIGCEARSDKMVNEMKLVVSLQHDQEGRELESHNDSSSSGRKLAEFANHNGNNLKINVANGASSVTTTHLAASDDTLAFYLSYLFGQKLLPVILKLYLEATPTEKCFVSAEIFHGIGRCMNTRRDNPNGTLWKVAVDGFNCVLIDAISRVNTDSKVDQNRYKVSRASLWKEVADVYEIFLVGSCGRVLSSIAPSADVLKADEVIEINLLSILGDHVLKSQTDAPLEVLERLVTTLDRCASRIDSLPLESVGLMPSHCCRFSLNCLQTIFSLCCFTYEDGWHQRRSEVSQIAISILLRRCEIILEKFLTDENDLGERLLPSVRIEETCFVLQELARLSICADTAAVLQLPSSLKENLEKNKNTQHTHLFILFPLLCELVVSRFNLHSMIQSIQQHPTRPYYEKRPEARVRELVRVLLRLLGTQLELK